MGTENPLFESTNTHANLNNHLKEEEKLEDIVVPIIPKVIGFA